MIEDDPKTFDEAMSTPETPHWKETINNEIDSIMQNHSSELVDLPPDMGVADKFDMFEESPVRIPLDPSMHLVKNTGESISQLRFTSNPNRDHWKALTRVLRYLKYTLTYGLQFTKYPAVLEGYCDANWISDMKDSKSTSGYVFTIGGAAKIARNTNLNMAEIPLPPSDYPTSTVIISMLDGGGWICYWTNGSSS
ncbi:uncharacterized protein LOC111411429 [Olea europaea var. sylvestris]|uniref:uncharacterized protein LOC111411429 n=1 Tax=Olea europaea var. sylvestris TaxID=158386 RepID=UPI000C1D5704|nr:uncharacterized protein LOC111411429 [Olea europaea var. sylvestris]